MTAVRNARALSFPVMLLVSCKKIGILPIGLTIAKSRSDDLRIAIRDDLSDNIYKLFCFFPTKIDIHFPMVIHGTFDLDNSRNQLVNSKKINIFLAN